MNRKPNRRQFLELAAGAVALTAIGRTSAAATTNATTAETVWNLNSMYGVTQAGFTAAINDAKNYFLTNPQDTLVIEIDPGTYPLSNDSGSTVGIIDVSNVNPGTPAGRLIVRGGGQRGATATNLVFDGTVDNLRARNCRQITFQSMHMTQAAMKVSQGDVVSVAPGIVLIDIHEGFPSPQDILDPETPQGMFLRAYDNTNKLNPLILDNDESPSPTNEQVPWASAVPAPEPGFPNRWQINLKFPTQDSGYKPTDMIGIKSKSGGGAYWIGTGSDFVFDDVMWTRETRGVFRAGFDNIRISNCTISRGDPINGQSPALASPGGGPQIGQPADAPVTNALVENCTFVGTGDDIVGFFNATAQVRNSVFKDSFARFLLYNSPGVEYENLGNLIARTPVVIAP